MRKNCSDHSPIIRTLPAVLLAACFIITALAFAGCGGKNGGATPAPVPGGSSELTDAQLKDVFAIAEAFLESGASMNSSSGIALSEIEKYVYHIYNGELEADGSGFAQVPAEEADARLMRYFGIAPMLRTGKRVGYTQGYYFENSSYFVRTNAPAAVNSELISCEKNDQGLYLAKVRSAKADGSVTEFSLTLSFAEEGHILMGCDRLEGR